MELIDQLTEVLQSRSDLPLYQRAVLKTVINILGQETKSSQRYWAFLNGQPRPNSGNSLRIPAFFGPARFIDLVSAPDGQRIGFNVLGNR